MNILDILALVLVGIYFFIGFVKGLLSNVLEIVIFVLSAGVAYVYYRKGGGLLGITLTLALTNIILNLISRRRIETLFENRKKVSRVSKFAGGAIGSLKGAVLVLLILVFLHLLNGTIGAAYPAIAKTLDDSFVYNHYKAISMASPIRAMKKVYRVGEILKASGGKMVLDEQATSKLRENAAIKTMLTDSELIESINRGDYAKIVLNPKFLSVLNNIELLKQILAAVLQKNNQAVIEKEVIKESVPSSKQAENCLAGIVYLQGSRAALINNEMHRVGSQIFGGKITEITENSVTVEFSDRRKQYAVGDTMP